MRITVDEDYLVALQSLAGCMVARNVPQMLNRKLFGATADTLSDMLDQIERVQPAGLPVRRSKAEVA